MHGHLNIKYTITVNQKINLQYIYIYIVLFSLPVRIVYILLCFYRTTFPHISGHSWGIHHFFLLRDYVLSVYWVISCRVTAISNSRSSLNLWQPRFCFSARRGFKSLGATSWLHVGCLGPSATGWHFMYTYFLTDDRSYVRLSYSG